MFIAAPTVASFNEVKSIACVLLIGGFSCCSLQALKVLRTAEFAPFVVFIAAPSLSALAELKTVNVSAPRSHLRSPHSDNSDDWVVAAPRTLRSV